MGLNKKVLSEATANLNSAKPPARKKDIIVDPAGQWKYPGQEYTFPGADYVDEYPQMKKGGQKKYSRSLEAKNRLFLDNALVKKKKKKNKKIFNPKAKYYQDGGVNRTKLTPEEEAQFQKFYSTLPDNLMDDDPSYDIRGYWDSEGRPTEFDYSQPKDSDGYYRAYSINANTGEYLKAPTHPTFQHAVDEDRKIGWRPVTNVYGRNIATENPALIEPEHSFLDNTSGPRAFKDGGSKLGPIPLNSGRKTLRDWTYGQSIGMLQEQDGGEADYIELDLTPKEIEEYKKGGYIVEDISVPSLTRFTKGGNKKKKKRETTSEELKLDSNTQLYKFKDDGSRAYAKSGDGKWYEYKTYDVGYNQEGERVTQGYFTEIDPSYDVEKNLVPDLTPMTTDETLSIKAGVTNLPTINIKEKYGLFEKLGDTIEKKYWENKLTDEEKQEARYLYHTEWYDPTRTRADVYGRAYYPQNFIEAIDYGFISTEDEWKKYVEDSLNKNAERRYPSIWDAYKVIYDRKKVQEARDREYAQLQAQLDELKEKNPKAYQIYKIQKAAEWRIKNDPNNKPQAAQSADWFWSAGVLGTAGLTTGALADLGALASRTGTSLAEGWNTPILSGLETSGGLATEVGISQLPAWRQALTMNNIVRGSFISGLGKKYAYEPIIEGKSINTTPYNFAMDVATAASPYNKYLSGIATANAINKGIQRAYEKSLQPESADDAMTIGSFLRAVTSLKKQKGGAIETELTPAEIEEYRRQGYIVEEY